MTPEGKVKKAIKALLDKYGAWYTMPYQAGYTRRGIPDFLGILHGRMFAIEAKADGGKTTKLQELELQKLRDQGCIALVVEGENTHVLAAWLEEIVLAQAKPPVCGVDMDHTWSPTGFGSAHDREFKCAYCGAIQDRDVS